MKKKILFVMNNLNCGGAEKALVSLLETIDYTLFDVDLFLFKHEGLFLSKLPKTVNLLPEPVKYKYFDMPMKSAVIQLLKQIDIKTISNRAVLSYLAKTENNGALIEQKLWRFLSRSLGELNKEYDIAIGFQEKNPIYFCVDKVRAKIKLGWVHTDYNKLGIDINRESYYFKKLDHVVTVSEELVGILKDNFPSCSEKFLCVRNIVSSKIIRKMSMEQVEFKKGSSKSISLISVGRLAKEKGLDLTLDALDILVRKGYDLFWYLVGDGNMKSELEGTIKEKGLEGRVIFLGMKENPYPYIRQADIYIQTSRYEGKSISIDEAKILAKPILITNFETAKNHVINYHDGIIAQMDALFVAKELEMLILKEQLRNRLKENLLKEDFGTEKEVEKLYSLIL